MPILSWQKTAEAIGSAFSSGIISINHHGLAMPETPFGGIGDSGFGKEGCVEAIESYFHTKLITQSGL
jgi:succinate-semialdehyde dehydrogenase/glutarate-semialdehyde dehydrogenase